MELEQAIARKKELATEINDQEDAVITAEINTKAAKQKYNLLMDELKEINRFIAKECGIEVNEEKTKKFDEEIDEEDDEDFEEEFDEEFDEKVEEIKQANSFEEFVDAAFDEFNNDEAPMRRRIKRAEQLEKKYKRVDRKFGDDQLIAARNEG